MMTCYNKCSLCTARLDPGEWCDSIKKEAHYQALDGRGDELQGNACNINPCINYTSNGQHTQEIFAGAVWGAYE